MGALATIALTVALSAPAGHGEQSLVALPNFKHTAVEQVWSRPATLADSSSARAPAPGVGHTPYQKLHVAILAVDALTSGPVPGRSPSPCVPRIEESARGEGRMSPPSAAAQHDPRIDKSFLAVLSGFGLIEASDSPGQTGPFVRASLLVSRMNCKGVAGPIGQTAPGRSGMRQLPAMSSSASSRTRSLPGHRSLLASSHPAAGDVSHLVGQGVYSSSRLMTASSHALIAGASNHRLRLSSS